MERIRARRLASVLLTVIVISGCGGKKTPADRAEPKAPELKPLEPTETDADPVTALRNKLQLNEGEGEIFRENGKISKVYLERTRVTDLSPLKGLPLTELYLSHTRVSDLSPLKDMPLKKLNLLDTQVTDISVVKTLDLNTLWLNDTKVKDLSPLKGKSLESLDLTGAPATDLSPLAGMESLRRLNLERSAVTDLTPLKGLKLNRLIFQPAKIKKGLDVARDMKQSLTEMHTRFPATGDGFLGPDEFWKRYKAGTLPSQ